MKMLLFGLFLLCTQLIGAQQIIENPSFKVRTGSILNIRKIERANKDTRLDIHVIFRPHWWITIDSTTYIEDTATGEKYYSTAIEGMKFNEQTYLPDAGEMDIALIFPPLPASTTCINFIEPSDSEGKTFGISLISDTKKKKDWEEISGNWISQDGNNDWTVGIYDSLAIYREQFWKYESVKKKGNRFLVNLQNETGSCLLTFKRDKDNCFLISDSNNEIRCGKKENNLLPPTRADQDFTDFFHTDTAYIQGYLQGYDSILGFSTGMIYIGNQITREDNPTVVTIHPDGRFESKFIIQHPVTSFISIQYNYIPFYIEPGQKLTVYLNYEAILNKNRTRDHYAPLKDIKYMGQSADISRSQEVASHMFQVDYDKTQKFRKELTPEQFHQEMSPVLPTWLSEADSVIRTNNYSAKAARLIRNTALEQYAGTMLDFSLFRMIEANQDTTNQLLKIKETDDFYDFIKLLPLDDATLMACQPFSTFINRFEYMNLFDTKIDMNMDKSRIMEFFQSRDSLNCIKLMNYIQADHIPLMQQLAFMRGLNFHLDFIGDKEKAGQYLQSVCNKITVPFFREEGDRLYKELYSDIEGSYPLPMYKTGSTILQQITDKYKGKYVLIDFWATTCGPCRYGIEQTSGLREKYNDSPDVKLIFITSETESPEADYMAFVEKNLKGEACYRIPEKDYHLLRELFRFNAIPHYETLNREGRVLRKGLTYRDFESRLKELLK